MVYSPPLKPIGGFDLHATIKTFLKIIFLGVDFFEFYQTFI